MLSSTCKHCGREITQTSGNMWVSGGKLIPQYCWVDPVHGSQLHEPSDVQRIGCDHQQVAFAIGRAMATANDLKGYPPEGRLAIQTILFGLMTALGLAPVHFWTEYNKTRSGLEVDHWDEAIGMLFGELNIETVDDLHPLID